MVEIRFGLPLALHRGNEALIHRRYRRDADVGPVFVGEIGLQAGPQDFLSLFKQNFQASLVAVNPKPQVIDVT